MANVYGVTDAGFVLKRMDTILEQVHGDLSEGYGFDTAARSDSVINVIATTFSNQIAEAWENLQDVYYSKYPFSATGVNLDNACQYGGIRREEAEPSYYKLHCTGDDGTLISAGTIVATYTMPKIKLLATDSFKLTREKFNQISIGVATVENSLYSISLNGQDYEYVNAGDNGESIIEGLASQLNDEKFVVTVVDGILSISCADNDEEYNIGLSDNLRVDSVTTIGEFRTEDDGNISIANRTITEILTTINGFKEVTNLLAPILGNDYESDIEFRQAYLAKCFSRSTSMIDSICAAILINVVGVESATGYENNTDVEDEDGRPPHSIEIVVDGGDGEEIANQIHRYRPGGIQTYGAEEYEIEALYGNKITIRFSRPEFVYAWFKVKVTGEDLPENMASLVQEAILSNIDELKAGDAMNIQKHIGTIYQNVAGVTNVDIKAYGTTNIDYVPKDEDFVNANIPVTKRQRIVTSIDRMEVS